MYDRFDFFDGISFDGQVVDVSSWVFLLASLVAVFVVHKMLGRGQRLKLAFVAASLLSLGIPSVVRLFFDQVLDRNRLALFIDLYPDFITNCFLVAACVEILMARCNAPRNVRIPFQFASAITIPLSIWWMSHLGGVDIFPVLIGSSSCIALGAICATAIVLRFKNRHSEDNYPLLTAGLFGVFIATNLMRFMPASKLTLSQIENVLMTGSVIALATISGLCLLLEGNNVALDRRLNITSFNDYE
jgi:fluoride ion exporter CrcB/FEX